jgi:hypothetical protein
MRRRRLLAVCAVLVALVAAGIAGEWVSEKWARWFAPELIRAVEASEPEFRITVGKNVHVSAARATKSHQGCTIAADAGTPARLFAASMVTPQGDDRGVVGYSSSDGGLTWELGVERLGRKPGEICCDEAAAFGPDGNLYLAHMRGRYKESADPADTEFLVSADGGRTWVEKGKIDGLVDRPQVTTDTSSGPFRGRIYCCANRLADARALAAVYASEDGAASLVLAGFPPRGVETIYNSNPVVLADGTVIAACHLLGHSASAAPRFPVFRSTDGGRNFTTVTPVQTEWRHPRFRSQSGTTAYPLLAADPGSSAFAGRLYCVWSDGPFILFASSTDHGDTWSGPVLLSEQTLLPDDSPPYYACIPAVAVNKLGHIAVLWYDRRGLPPEIVTPGARVKMAGYNLRLRASTDGGRTWLPSIQINETPGRGDPVDVRVWVGMAAAADGRFHPAWISDTSGTLQIWSAVISLEDAR